MFSKRKFTVIGLALLLAMFAAGCKKKVAIPPPAKVEAPPPPSAPVAARPAAPQVVQFTAEPSSIQRGQSSTLRWEVSGNVQAVSISEGVGTVQNTGNRQVSPSNSTTYTLTATGAGGSTSESATVTVTAPAPPPPPPPAPTRTVSFNDRLSGDIQDAYFDYDKTDLRGDARDALTKDAGALKSILADFPNSSIVLEGHCDERGSAEYNLGLGDRRATSAKEFLQQLGIPADRIKTVSYGKERQQCSEGTEECYQKNRRVHFAPGQ